MVLARGFDDFLAVGVAALAADCITTWRCLWGGCACGRLDHGFRTDKQTGGGEHSENRQAAHSILASTYHVFRDLDVFVGGVLQCL